MPPNLGGLPPGRVPIREVTTRSGRMVRDFHLIWAGETVSQVGSEVSLLALPLVAVTTLHASVLSVGLLSASSTLAFLLVGLPAGAWVDRVRRRPVLIAADIGRCLAIGSIPITAALGDLGMGQLYLVSICSGVLTVFFDVAYQSYLPAIVGRDVLVAANARLQASESSAQVAGPTIAGWLVQAIGGPYAVAVDAATFLVSAGAVRSISAEVAPPDRHSESPSLRAEIGEGLRFVLGHPMLRAIAATTSTANLFGTMAVAIQVIFLVRTIGLGSGAIGLLFSAGSVGGIVGALTAPALARRLGSARVTIWAIGVSGGGGFLLPLTHRGPTVALFAIGTVFGAFGAVVYNVNQVSFRQALCPPELLGRMNATMRFLVWGSMPVGGTLGAVIGSHIGLRTTLWIAAAGALSSTGWLLASPLRTLRDFPTVNLDAKPPDATGTDPEEPGPPGLGELR